MPTAYNSSPLSLVTAMQEFGDAASGVKVLESAVEARLREGIAEAEFALAEREQRYGDPALARARAEYVVEHYPRTQAAADAARLLLNLGSQ